MRMRKISWSRNMCDGGPCLHERAWWWCQPLSLRDEVTLNSAHTLKHTHTRMFTFFQYHKGKPSLAAAL